MQKLGPKQQQWIDALKSGKYKQGKGQLKREVGGEYFYCCLGVANEVLCLNESSDISLFTTCNKIGLHNHLGGSVKEELYLTEMNDNGFSFEQIAKILETEPENYFKEPV